MHEATGGFRLRLVVAVRQPTGDPGDRHTVEHGLHGWRGEHLRPHRGQHPGTHPVGAAQAAGVVDDGTVLPGTEFLELSLQNRPHPGRIGLAARCQGQLAAHDLGGGVVGVQQGTVDDLLQRSRAHLGDLRTVALGASRFAGDLDAIGLELVGEHRRSLVGRVADAHTGGRVHSLVHPQ